MTTLLELYGRIKGTTPAITEPLRPVTSHVEPAPLRDAIVNPVMATAFHRALRRAGWTAKRIGDGYQYRQGTGPWTDLQSAAIRATCRI